MNGMRARTQREVDHAMSTGVDLLEVYGHNIVIRGCAVPRVRILGGSVECVDTNIEQVTGSADVKSLGSTTIRSVGGHATLWAGEHSLVGFIIDHARAYNITGQASVDEVGGDAVIEAVSGESHIGTIHSGSVRFVFGKLEHRLHRRRPR